MCLNETYSRVLAGDHLGDTFLIRKGLKHGDALLPLLCNFAVEYVISRVQVNQDGFKQNGTHQLLVYADNVNDKHTYYYEKKTEALVTASKDTELK